jgi:hypothetical protein
LSVNYRVHSYGADHATLSCWSGTDGEVYPLTLDEIVLEVKLEQAKLVVYHHKKGMFSGWRGGAAVNTVGCTLQFRPGGSNSTLDIDNVDVQGVAVLK